MDIDRNAQLTEQLDGHWQHQLRPRLDGLTDEEYFWEPVAPSWSLRPRGQSTAPIAVGGVRALGADGLARPCGPAEGPFADFPLAALVLHINREVLHHGAEIALLRDLYRDRG